MILSLTMSKCLMNSDDTKAHRCNIDIAVAHEGSALKTSCHFGKRMVYCVTLPDELWLQCTLNGRDPAITSKLPSCMATNCTNGQLQLHDTISCMHKSSIALTRGSRNNHKKSAA
jgi:hypothetical protein